MDFANKIPRIFFDLQSLYPLHFGKIMAQQLSFQMSTSIFVWYVYVFYAFEKGSYTKRDLSKVLQFSCYDFKLPISKTTYIFSCIKSSELEIHKYLKQELNFMITWKYKHTESCYTWLPWRQDRIEIWRYLIKRADWK